MLATIDISGLYYNLGAVRVDFLEEVTKVIPMVSLRIDLKKKRD